MQWFALWKGGYFLHLLWHFLFLEPSVKYLLSEVMTYLLLSSVRIFSWPRTSSMPSGWPWHTRHTSSLSSLLTKTAVQRDSGMVKHFTWEVQEKAIFTFNNFPVPFTLNSILCLYPNRGIWEQNVKVAFSGRNIWCLSGSDSYQSAHWSWYQMMKEEEYGFSLTCSTGATQGSPLGIHPASIFTFSKVHISLVRMLLCLWESVQFVRQCTVFACNFLHCLNFILVSTGSILCQQWGLLASCSIYNYDLVFQNDIRFLGSKMLTEFKKKCWFNKTEMEGASPFLRTSQVPLKHM